MIRRIRTWLWLGGLFALCQWLAPAGMAPLDAAQASVAGINCTATVTSIDFGIADTSWLGSDIRNGNSNLQTTGYVTYFCTNTTAVAKSVDVCISIGNPGGSAQRSLASSGNGTISYQLYKDPNGQTTWGSNASPSTWGSPFVAPNVSVPASGTTAPVTVPIYAALAGNQSLFTGSGSYSALYTNADVGIDTGTPGACTGTTGGTIVGFKVMATLQPTCQVYTNTLDFGTATTGDPSNATASTTVTVACSRHTGYRVGLDTGKNYDGSTRRMRGGPTHSDYVPYELYRDSNCTLPWGNTDGTDTQTGSAQTQDFTVCGKIPPNQGMPPAGDYFDAVTVYVYY